MSIQELNQLLDALLIAFRQYMQARKTLLNHLQIPFSGRDPLAEFSEIIVNTLLQGTIASSRTQKGYDIITKEQYRLQVKYLFNPQIPWINEHAIIFTDGIDQYALVIYEEQALQSILIFNKETIEQVCRQLGKRHPNQKTTLLFTRRNYQAILTNIKAFQDIKVQVYLFT